MKIFLNPKSIAIIGASREKNKIGNILLGNLSTNKNIKVLPINPKYEKIGAVKCYKSVLNISEKVDLAIIAIPARFVLEAINQCIKKDDPIKNIIIISAGFSEAGKEGAELEAEIKAVARKHDLNILGPNCLGVINVQKNINASFAKEEVKKGDVGLIMQSGAFTTALLDIAEKNNFGFSSVVTLGNKVCLDEVDFMDYYRNDSQTRTVVLYLENIKRGRRFRKKLCDLAKEKEVIILKAGNSKKVQSAIQSHTGSMAGEIDIIKEVIKDAGAIYVGNISQLVNILKLNSNFRKPQNNKAVIITNAGGPGVVATDLFEISKNLKMKEFSDKEKEIIKEGLPAANSVENPIDILGDADSERYALALKNLNKIKNVGFAVFVVTPQAQTDLKNIANVIIEANQKSVFPVYPVFIVGKSKKEVEEVLSKNDLCNFDFPVNLIEGLDDVIGKNKSIDNPLSGEIVADDARIKSAEKVVNSVYGNGNKVLYFNQAAEICGLYGIESIETRTIEDEKEIQDTNWHFPVVLKVDSQTLLHKKSKGGVVLNIDHAEDLQKNYFKMKRDLNEDRFVVQSQVEYEGEIILGIKDDSSFGKVVMVGMGGIFTEILNQKEIFLLPNNQEMIKRRLEKTSIAKILKKDNLGFNALVNQIEKLSRLAVDIDSIKELDINPIVYHNKKWMALDIKLILKDKK